MLISDVWMVLGGQCERVVHSTHRLRITALSDLTNLGECFETKFTLRDYKPKGAPLSVLFVCFLSDSFSFRVRITILGSMCMSTLQVRQPPVAHMGMDGC